MDKLTHYRTALYLLLVAALTSLVGWGLIFASSPHLTKEAITICTVPFLILVGFWVQSVIVSSIGVLWMLFWGVALVWGLVSALTSSRPTPITVGTFIVISAALNLFTAGIMVTKKVRTEFAYERQHRPKYKTYLNWAVFGTAIVAIVIATYIAIMNLPSTP